MQQHCVDWLVQWVSRVYDQAVTGKRNVPAVNFASRETSQGLAPVLNLKAIKDQSSEHDKQEGLRTVR